MSATWRGTERRRRIDRYGVIRALLWLAISLGWFLALAAVACVVLQIVVAVAS